MQRIICIALLCAISVYTSAQDNDTTQIHDIKIGEVVISANKFKEHKENVAQTIQTIGKKEIEWAMPQTSATLLEQTGNIFVQRSQAGGGSPVIRGFEANRVLLIVDGVRMNNAIYRGGHLQNIITLDNNMLEAVEVLHGPASTLYGSDALGGAMVFRSKQPTLAEWKGIDVHTNFMTRYSSANNENTGHIDFNLGWRKFASLTSVTYSRFGHTRQGNLRSPYNDSFGARTYYVERIGDVDRVVLNRDKNLQKYTGYNQVDVMQKFLYEQNEKIKHTLNFQMSTSSDVPRYDRLTDMKNDSLRYAEWYYGPQQRIMAAYQLNAVNLNGFVDEVTAGVNYQSIEESRHQRSFGDDVRQNRTDNLDVIGYNIDLRKKMNNHEVTLGTDGQYNNVRSSAYGENLVTGARSSLDTRYPDGGSNMYYGAIYAQHIYKIVPDKLILNDGIRYNYVQLNATFNDKTFFPFPYSSASQTNNALSGNLGLIYMPAKQWRFVLNGSTGFRSPNIDDLGKVFESQGGEILVVPNPDVSPEYSYNADLGVSYTDDEHLKVDLGGYYTWLNNAIVQDLFTLNGQSMIMYDGQLTQVVASQNKAEAYVCGLNAAITAKFNHVTFYNTFNYTYGRYNNAGTTVPLDHIPPVFGKTSIMYNKKKYSGEFYVMYNGWKRLKDYSPSGEDNLKYATSLGMPSWYTLNLRTGYNINDNMSVQLAMENIMDKNYRVFASGVSMPGRNVVLTLRGRL
ncbi:MAG: TonB-dependent receptor [Chitinophagales bacterium]|nr:TonB-dependent receptor [Chitinophagaceae bacterium]MCB9065796.1 TonB-dependent receptor [Chitinophagales bacterium]